MATTKEDRLHNLKVAITRAGGIVKFSQDLGLSMQAIGGWKRRGHVPFDQALKLERLYGVPRESLVKPEIAEAYLAPRDSGSDLL